MHNHPSGTVTFLFTDIEESTKLAQQYPDAMPSLLARHHEILNQSIQAQNGYVFQVAGDSFAAAFHSPNDALNAALEAQRYLQNESWSPASINVRMGIHTGAAQLNSSSAQNLYSGYTTLALTQRIMSAGHGGQILLTNATEALLRGQLPKHVNLRDMGEHKFKDVFHPVRVFQVIAPDLQKEFPALRALDVFPNNLPIQLTSFIGREKEMEEIKQSILTHRLITLTGSGGTGKTRLSMQVAADMLDQFPDGVWFVELAALSNPDFIPQTILSALGIPEQRGLTVLQLLMDYLRKKRILLVLDNCEHLIEACATLVDTLLNNAYALNIMATSREALGVTGEMIWHVPSLSLPDVKHLPAIEQLSQYEAVQLFIERVTLVQPHFIVTNDNAPAIAQICFRLDGIPLALELAAARVRALSVDQITKRLDDRFRLLIGGSRTALERHQTLRATIDWSYNLLSGDEKLLLCRLAVFVGGWTLEAAEQVCAGKNHISSYDVLDLLTHLVDKSLVIMDESRYHMLETTRQYAREKLLGSGQGETLHDKHLIYFLDLAEQADQEIHGPDQIEWMDRLEKEHDNFRSALDWCASEQNTESALRLLGALNWVWWIRDHFSEVESWFDKICALPEASDYPALYARLLNYIGDPHQLARDFRYAQSVLEESRAIWLKLGVDGELGLAEALDFLGVITLFNEGDHKAARSFFEQSFELYQKHRDQRGLAMTMYYLGNTTLLQGHYAEAEEEFMKSLAKFEELSDKFWSARVLNGLGELLRLQGDYERAGKFYEQNLEIFRELRSRIPLAISLFNLAWVSLHGGNYRKAKALFEESLELSKEASDRRDMVDCLVGFASVLGMIDKPEQAARLFGAVESFYEGIGKGWRMDLPDQKEFDHYVAAVHGQLDEAAFAKAWAEGRAMTMDQAVAYALEDSGG